MTTGEAPQDISQVRRKIGGTFTSEADFKQAMQTEIYSNREQNNDFERSDQWAAIKALLDSGDLMI